VGNYDFSCPSVQLVFINVFLLCIIYLFFFVFEIIKQSAFLNHYNSLCSFKKTMHLLVFAMQNDFFFYHVLFSVAGPSSE